MKMGRDARAAALCRWTPAREGMVCVRERVGYAFEFERLAALSNEP